MVTLRAERETPTMVTLRAEREAMVTLRAEREASTTTTLMSRSLVPGRQAGVHTG